MHSQVWDEIISNSNGCIVELDGRIDNFISHFRMDVITYQR